MGKRIAILGSTGSIGTSTVDVVRALGPEYRVTGLSASRRWRELAEQCREVVIHLAQYAGYPRVSSLVGLVERIVGEVGAA